MAELAEEVGLAIPDFEGYKTRQLRGVPKGVSRNGIARSKGIETVVALEAFEVTTRGARNGIARSKGIETVGCTVGVQTSAPFPQRHRPFKGH